MYFKTIALTIIAGLTFVRAVHEDLITKLPGLDMQIAFKQYSGYLNGSNDNIQLHYWFVEANVAKNDLPLVLWLNGGPGCSSLSGLLTENGPFVLQNNGNLDLNPTAWNSFANVLYLEAPAGVGFSYSLDQNYTFDDDLVARDNLFALKSFYAKFPQYKSRDLYLTGESFAGIYIPTLAMEIIKDGQINTMKGILIGNALTNYQFNENSKLYYAYYHGFIRRSAWKVLIENCCGQKKSIDTCLFTESKSGECIKMLEGIRGTLKGDLNNYNIVQKCHHNNTGNDDILPCVDLTLITKYLRRYDTMEALHVKKGLDPYSVCTHKVFDGYIRKYSNVSSQILNILDKDISVWLYNGDLDLVCNFIGQEWFVDNLGIREVFGLRQWLYSVSETEKQIGGFIKSFQKDDKGTLNFLTVKGAGHLVPTDAPTQALHIFKSFLGILKI